MESAFDKKDIVNDTKGYLRTLSLRHLKRSVPALSRVVATCGNSRSTRAVKHLLSLTQHFNPTFLSFHGSSSIYLREFTHNADLNAF